MTAVVLPRSTAIGDDAHFERSVRPLLVQRCYKCHGPTKQAGGLRLDSGPAVLRGGDRGAAVVPGEPESSLLMAAVRRQGELKMPPDRELSVREKAILQRWVGGGAAWPAKVSPPPGEDANLRAEEPLWSFQPVRNPQLPTVETDLWCRDPVDRFLLKRMQTAGLSPALPLAAGFLLRRVTFDLTGLPPTPDEITAFKAATAPDAYARVVDRLLAAPTYGERWGRHWLDVVRYCDSRDARHTGQPYDVNEAWRYRDWVVDAFNRDLPYDAFVRQQIAGDCLPMSGSQEDAASGLIATGMLVIGEWGSGDADAKKMYTDIVDDQIHVVTQAFLGVSLSCARCHDHKFDPFTARDYYAMAGIFFSTQIATPRTDAPLMRVPLLTQGDRELRKGLQAKLVELETQLSQLEDSRRAQLRAKLVPHTSRYLQAAWELERDRLQTFDTTRISQAVEEISRAFDLDPVIVRAWDRALGQRVGQGELLNVAVVDAPEKGVFCWKTDAVQPLFLANSTPRDVYVPGHMIPHSVAVHPTPSRGVAVAWRSTFQGSIHVSGRVSDAHQGGNGIEWSLEKSHGVDVTHLATGSFGRGEKTEFGSALDPVTIHPGDRIRLVIFPKAGNHVCDLTRLELELKEAGGAGRTWNLAKDVVGNPAQGNPHNDSYGNPAVWQFLHMVRRLGQLGETKPEIDALQPWFTAATTGDTTTVVAACDHLQGQLLRGPKSNEKIVALRDWLVSSDGLLGKGDQVALSVGDAAQRDELMRQRDALRERLLPVDVALAAHEGGVSNTVHEGFQDARIHIRGDYTRLGAQIARGVPASLAGQNTFPVDAGSGRVELAEWIANKSHPLTARVMVNRIWLHHFGAALVRTPGDFGRQGEMPTHPLLLDWLANYLVTSSWSIKSIHRRLLSSAAYQQSGGERDRRSDREGLRLDPENRWWSRVESQRLEVEAIRDAILAVAGELDRRIGGPSAARYPGGYSRTERKTAVFSSRRRALYVMTIRGESSDGPFVLDAADPNRVVHQRSVSTTAPQALLMMNDPFVRSVAEILSLRILRSADRQEERVEHLYQLLYGRAPSMRELAASQRFLGQPSGDRQRWDDYCHALLCTNELIYRN